MTKPEMIEELSRQTGVTKADTRRVIDALMLNIREEVAINGRYAFYGLGVFKKAARKPCVRNHPQKPGEKVNIPARNTVTFRAEPGFKEMVNK